MPVVTSLSLIQSYIVINRILDPPNYLNCFLILLHKFDNMTSLFRISFIKSVVDKFPALTILNLVYIQGDPYLQNPDLTDKMWFSSSLVINRKNVLWKFFWCKNNYNIELTRKQILQGHFFINLTAKQLKIMKLTLQTTFYNYYFISWIRQCLTSISTLEKELGV